MADWSKRRRLEAAIAGEKVDRLPVALWRHWPGDDQEAEALAAVHVKWQQDYDWDLVKVSPASSYCLVDWGLEDRWMGHEEGTREYVRRVVSQPQDWAELKVLDPQQGMLATQLQTLELLRAPFGEEVPYLATIFSPLAQARNLSGGDLLLSHMRSHPQLLLEGLKTITESTLRYVERAKEAGISGIYYAIQHARYALLSTQEYMTFGQPFDEEILAAASDLPFNMVHLHGAEGIIFDLAADYDVPMLNWHDRDTGLSLKTGLEQFSGAASGGVSQKTMHLGTPDDVLQEARDALEQTGGRRLLLGTGCVIMTNSPARNIRALRDFAEQAPGS